MGRNRSLDDFAGGGTDSEDADDQDASHDDDERAPDAGVGDAETETTDDVESADADAVAPATVTYDWSPDGAACERCGETVERRWLDDGEHVCESCKEW